MRPAAHVLDRRRVDLSLGQVEGEDLFPPAGPQPLLVQLGHSQPLARRGERPAGDQGVDVRVPVQQFPVGLDRHDHPGQGGLAAQLTADLVRTHRQAQPASLPSSLRSKRACSRKRLGMVSTTCRCATGKQTSSATWRAATSARFWWQLGQAQRCLQEKATKNSWRQSGQRTRAKPSARSPQRRNAATARSTTGRQKPYLAANRSG